MAIWIIFAVMTAAAVFAVLRPLSRRAIPAAGSEPIEMRFYRDQIAEIERDLARGLITPAEADGAKAEAARRLLRAADAAAATDRGLEAMGEPALRRRRAVSAIALSVVPLLALGVYGIYGSPQLPAQPLSARQQADPQAIDMAEAVARIEAHLATHPEDGRGWEVVAPVYLRAGRFEDAAKAFEAAIRLLGESAPRLANYGEALVAAKDGVVTAQARAAFEKALALDPASAKAGYYLAQAAEQDGHADKARAHYAAIIERSPADAPWVPVVKERLARLDGQGATAAVAALPQKDREAAIRAMVEGLAARLEANGGTAEEWSRLVRSYAVLGERDKARTALNKARQALAQAGTQPAFLDTVARELDLDEARR